MNSAVTLFQSLKALGIGLEQAHPCYLNITYGTNQNTNIIPWDLQDYFT